MHEPITPFPMIITAAKTVSLAINSDPSIPDSIIETIRATSIIVIQIARMSDPNGSPTLTAIFSAK